MSRDGQLVRAGQLAQIARQGALIFIALALPRLGVSRGLIGEWEGLLFVGYFLGTGWLTGLLQAYLIEVRQGARTQGQRSFSRQALLVTSLISASLLTLVALLHGPFFRWMGFSGPPPGWYWFFLYLLGQWPLLLFEQWLVVAERPKTLAAFGILGGLGTVLAVLLPVWWGMGFEASLGWLAAFGGTRVLAAALIFNFTPVVDNEFRCAREEAHRWWPHKSPVRALLYTAEPLVLYAIGGVIVTSFDPWFVNYWYEGDPVIFAIFRYGTREIPLLSALVNGMTVVALARLSTDLTSGLVILRERSLRLMHTVFPGVIFLMLTAGYWWVPLFTEAFADSLPLFRIFLFLAVSRMLFPMQVLSAAGEARYLPWFTVGELVINVVLSLLLAPRFGLAGVVWATVITYTLDKVALLWFTWWRLGVVPGAYTEWRWFGGYCVLLVVSYLSV